MIDRICVRQGHSVCSGCAHERKGDPHFVCFIQECIRDTLYAAVVAMREREILILSALFRSAFETQHDFCTIVAPWLSSFSRICSSVLVSQKCCFMWGQNRDSVWIYIFCNKTGDRLKTDRRRGKGCPRRGVHIGEAEECCFKTNVNICRVEDRITASMYPTSAAQ